MGNALASKYTLTHLWKEDEPDCLEPIQYDPAFGFNQPRELLVPVSATVEELDSVGLEPELRNECAHKTLLLMGCRKQYSPFIFMCSGLKQELRDCRFDSFVRDMKEFERERRLNMRERRIRERSS